MSVEPESQGDSARPPSKRLGFQRPLQTIKRVSGKLRRLLHGQKKNTEQSQRLLIVDDEQTICFSMNEYFTRLGFQVDTASDREQAERYIRATAYEVIIQDLRLGTRSTEGLEIIRFARQHSPDTKVIVLTAYGSAQSEDEARRSGAVAFLRKPQPLSQVAQVVRGVIESPRWENSH